MVAVSCRHIPLLCSDIDSLATVTRIMMCLLLLPHCCTGHETSDDSLTSMFLSGKPQLVSSLFLLGLTMVLSSTVYLCVLSYVCVGCCQPVAVGTESDALTEIV